MCCRFHRTLLFVVVSHASTVEKFTVEVGVARGCGQELGLDERFSFDNCPALENLTFSPGSAPSHCAGHCVSNKRCKSWSHDSETGACGLFSWTLRGTPAPLSVASGEVDPDPRVVHAATVGLPDLIGHTCSCNQGTLKRPPLGGGRRDDGVSPEQTPFAAATHGSTARRRRRRSLLVSSFNVLPPPTVPSDLKCSPVLDECRLTRQATGSDSDATPVRAVEKGKEGKTAKKKGSGRLRVDQAAPRHKSFQDLWTLVRSTKRVCAPWARASAAAASFDLEQNPETRIITSRLRSQGVLSSKALTRGRKAPSRTSSMQVRRPRGSSRQRRRWRRRLGSSAGASAFRDKHDDETNNKPTAEGGVVDDFSVNGTTASSRRRGSPRRQHHDYSEVVTIAQVKGHEMFHFLIEGLARWAVLPHHERRKVLSSSSSPSPASSASSSSSSSSPFPRLATTMEARLKSAPPHNTTKVDTKAVGANMVVHIATSNGGPPTKRQLELLALVGVPPAAVVFGTVRGRRVLVPGSVTCGTPSKHQVRSLRALLLQAWPIRRLLLLNYQNVLRNNQRYHTRRHLLLADQRGNNHDGDTNNVDVRLRDNTGVDSSGAGAEDEAWRSFYRGHLWAVDASVDVLVVRRSRQGGRGLGNHDALVAALENASYVSEEEAFFFDGRDGLGATAEEEQAAAVATAAAAGGGGGENERDKKRTEGRRKTTAAGTASSSLLSKFSASSTEVVAGLPKIKKKLTVRVFSDAAGSMPSTQAEILALFASAQVIVGPHGAGLANMVLARPSASVVEARTRSSPLCYAHLADRLGLRYYSACGGGGGGGGVRVPCEGDGSGDILLDVSRVVAIVLAALRNEAAALQGLGHQDLR